MDNRIFEMYNKKLSYRKTAAELGIDERTVKRVVGEHRKEAGSHGKEGSHAAAPLNGKTGAQAQPTLGIKSASSEHDGREDNKIIFREFLAGRMTAQIIADHGFDADYVEKQYSWYCRQRECDVLTLQNNILNSLSGLAKTFEVRPYRQLFEKKGYLTNDEIMQLLHKVAKRNADRAIERIFGPVDGNPPLGWLKLRCNSCHLGFAIVRQDDEIVKKFNIVNFYGQDHTDCSKPRGFS